MAREARNTQLFALRRPPPAFLEVDGCKYRLVKVFKHDFFAATALYHAEADGEGPPQLVVKFGREQDFCGLGGAWIGRLLRRREQRFHRRADGIDGIQPWVAQISPTAYALRYIEGETLDRVATPPEADFFDKLRTLLDALHAQGAAYCDLNKRSNIVVTPDGRPTLIDFQISLCDNERANPLVRWLLKRWVAYFQRMDLYHLYKHKRRLAPEALTDAERVLGTRRGWSVRLHRRLVTPLRHLRRRFLSKQHRTGRLASPTAGLEEHDQPEKATWRQ